VDVEDLRDQRLVARVTGGCGRFCRAGTHSPGHRSRNRVEQYWPGGPSGARRPRPAPHVAARLFDLRNVAEFQKSEALCLLAIHPCGYIVLDQAVSMKSNFVAKTPVTLHEPHDSIGCAKNARDRG